jgi:2-methylcitrate dehydratase PrpD
VVVSSSQLGTTVGGASGTAGDPPAVALADLVLALVRIAPDPAAREIARARIADTALATAVGLSTDQGRRGTAVAAALYGADSVAARAYRLVAACRMTEIDDIDLVSCITPGSLAVLTALAVLGSVPEVGEVPVEHVLDVVVAGYELALGLGEAMRGPRRLPTGVWPSLAAGSVTAAVVTTLLLDHEDGADDADLERAAVLAAEQSIAGNARGTARENLLAGAVVTGIGAALAVRHGFAVAGSRGGGVLGGLLAEAVEPSVFGGSGGSGAASRIARPSVKGFCSARQAMGPVAALRSILAGTPLTAGGVGGIEAIEVEVPHEYVAMLSRSGVAGRRESLSNVAYQLATAVLCPERLDDVARVDLGLDDALLDLMATVSVHGSDELSALYPARWPARVRVRAGGRTYHGEALEVPGETDHSRAAVEAKTHRFLAGDPALADLILSSCWGEGTDPLRLAVALDGERPLD